MAFQGWPAEALEFYEGLAADNTRTYWLAHKDDYDESVRMPTQALLDELAPRWGAGKIFRPYRDVRFSADKTPYKTHIGALLEGGGYVQLSAEGLAAGCGTWHMESEALRRFREAVADDSTGGDLVGIVAALRRKGIDTLSRESLKTGRLRRGWAPRRRATEWRRSSRRPPRCATGCARPTSSSSIPTAGSEQLS